MEEEQIFDRARLMSETRERLEKWCKKALEEISGHEGNELRQVIEDIVSRGQGLGIPIKSEVTRFDDESPLYFEVLAKKPYRSRPILTLSEEGDGQIQAIERLEEMIESLKSERPEDNHILLLLAHTIKAEENRQKGFRLIGIDPIAIRMISRIDEIDFQMVVSEMKGRNKEQGHYKLAMQGQEESRIPKYLENDDFLGVLADGKIDISKSPSGVAYACGALEYLTLSRNLDVIQVKSQKHQEATLRHSQIFTEHEIPKSITHSAAGRYLDEIFESDLTKGLGLKIETIEEASKGFCIKTDADKHLTFARIKVKS